jgi:hypothetical protein
MKLTILCSRESANTNLPTFFVALVLFVASASVLRAQLPNPAAYLTFDEGAGTVAHDSSGNNHNATLQGGAGWTVARDSYNWRSATVIIPDFAGGCRGR